MVLLGNSVWKAFLLPHGVPQCGSWEDGNIVFYRVPHPSGRNHWYNAPSNRRAVGKLLARLAIATP